MPTFLFPLILKHNQSRRDSRQVATHRSIRCISTQRCQSVLLSLLSTTRIDSVKRNGTYSVVALIDVVVFPIRDNHLQYVSITPSTSFYLSPRRPATCLSVSAEPQSQSLDQPTNHRRSGNLRTFSTYLVIHTPSKDYLKWAIGSTPPSWTDSLLWSPFDGAGSLLVEVGEVLGDLGD